ncbi:unnamed protein product [Cylindrotheca closterium]|uniref:Uncharacterized protein n=1 Tax=Cylindrotheca closterium TaxID=2856 RepID=A0AAD2GDT6_9STRA|nr:unnamed protein product [Cylindrotheca closterium]
MDKGVVSAEIKANDRSGIEDSSEDDDSESSEEQVKKRGPFSPGRCALCFFGLPRSYESVVLPTIEKNILRPNAKYRCDVFVHFFDQATEAAGRYNDGGKIDPSHIYFLDGSVRKVYDEFNQARMNRSSMLPAVVQFVNDTDDTFITARRHQLKKYHNSRNEQGNQIYFPWKSNWKNSSMDNMIKQWHSINASFSLMESYGQSHSVRYERVAMLRNDVLYVTPIDIYLLDNLNKTIDYDNSHFVMPPFCRYPVNDRMIYGPYGAVRIWATQRFDLIEHRVRQAKDEGYEMHSERFLDSTVLPTMEALGYHRHMNPDVCFVRTRTNGIVMVNDCFAAGVTRGLVKENRRDIIIQALGRKCSKEITDRDDNTVFYLDCDNVGESTQLSKSESQDESVASNDASVETWKTQNRQMVDDSTESSQDDDSESSEEQVKKRGPFSPGRCALCFFGLPRSYESVVLPTIEKNILRPNAKYRCDVFVHFFDQATEAAGRYNDGGKIDPSHIYFLDGSVRKVYDEFNQARMNRSSMLPAVVQFVNDTDDTFITARRHQLKKYHNSRNEQGNQIYFPWKSNWKNSSMDNMIKQWHSINASFSLMESYGQSHSVRYERVAMLRNDVLYVTPIDIYLLDNLNKTIDYDNSHFVMPPFCRYPVNDRMIYGPYGAVRIWATQRFDLIEHRVRQAKDEGYEMHSERFLDSTVLPTMEALGYHRHMNPDVCFVRTRTNGIVMVNDCFAAGVTRGLVKENRRDIIIQALGRNCSEEITDKDDNTVFYLKC